MELYQKDWQCFSCGACQDACPAGALALRPDSEGFLYPAIDAELCTQCGRCREVCLAREPFEKGILPERGVAFLSDDAALRAKCSSGGAFYELARAFLDEHDGGRVYGARLTSGLKVVHGEASDVEGLKAFYGSKYVQSDLTGVFKSAAACLERGERVLFSGTPCQTAALARFASPWSERLTLIDLVCNGGASASVWEHFLKLEEERNGSRVTGFCFRDKTFPRGRGVSYSLEDGWTIAAEHGRNLFSVCYMRGLILRPSCYRCPYATPARASDVTLGDFHGLEKLDPSFAPFGASLLLIHTPRGEELFTKLKGKGRQAAYPLESCLQPRLAAPAATTPIRKFLLADLQRLACADFLKKYGRMV